MGDISIMWAPHCGIVVVASKVMRSLWARATRSLWPGQSHAQSKMPNQLDAQLQLQMPIT